MKCPPNITEDEFAYLVKFVKSNFWGHRYLIDVGEKRKWVECYCKTVDPSTGNIFDITMDRLVQLGYVYCQGINITTNRAIYIFTLQGRRDFETIIRSLDSL